MHLTSGRPRHPGSGSRLTPVKDTTRFLAEDQCMTEAVISVEKAVGIIRDSALRMTGQCADRGSQLLHAVEDRPIGIFSIGTRNSIGTRKKSDSVRRRRDKEDTWRPTC